MVNLTTVVITYLFTFRFMLYCKYKCLFSYNSSVLYSSIIR
jgi:hypothetical protein